MKFLFLADYKILETKDINFKCQCSKENFASALLTLKSEELKKLVKDDKIEVMCQFCNEKYIFSKLELEQLYNKE